MCLPSNVFFQPHSLLAPSPSSLRLLAPPSWPLMGNLSTGSTLRPEDFLFSSEPHKAFLKVSAKVGVSLHRNSGTAAKTITVSPHGHLDKIGKSTAILPQT